MKKPISRFKKIQLKYSITDSTLQVDNKIKDNAKPFTLIEWLDNTQSTLGNTDEYIDDYNIYLHEWTDIKDQSAVSAKKTISETYISLLKEIVLNYSSAEERRYFNTLNYTDPLDLDATIPLFARRIKEIILYFTDKRELIKFQKTKFSLRGSNHGVERLIYNDIISTLNGDSVTTTLGQTLPEMKDVVSNFRVSIDELYDLSEEYYDGLCDIGAEMFLGFPHNKEI